MVVMSAVPQAKGGAAELDALQVPQWTCTGELAALPLSSPLPESDRTGPSQPASPVSPPQDSCAGHSSSSSSTTTTALHVAGYEPLRESCDARTLAEPCARSPSLAALPSDSQPPSPHTLPQREDRQDATTADAAVQQPQEQRAAGTAGGASAPHPPLDGSLLATCRLLGFLGKGAFGEVQRVLVTPVSGPAFEAARKRIPACSVVARKMFAVEVNALKEGMGCTNVVQLLDYRTTATHHEILLELLRGGMLGDELVSCSTRLPEARVRSLALDTLHGLAHLHARQVCCRDITLENIMLREPGGQAVLVDFGLACKTDANGKLKGIAQHGGVGTPTHMAPEVLGELRVPSAVPSGKPGKQRQQLVPITTKCDVYALGVALAYCAGGQAAHLRSVPLRNFLMQLVARWPDDRLTAAEALRHPYLAAAQQ